MKGDVVEWASHSVSGVFASPRNLVSPKFHKFLSELLYFNSHAGNLLLLPSDHPARQVTIGEYLRKEGYSDAFASYYLVPMMAALWSASMEDVMDFPASSLVEFMCNHRMLQLFDRPQVSSFESSQIFVFMILLTTAFFSLRFFFFPLYIMRYSI